MISGAFSVIFGNALYHCFQQLNTAVDQIRELVYQAIRKCQYHFYCRRNQLRQEAGNALHQTADDLHAGIQDHRQFFSQCLYNGNYQSACFF